MNKINIKGQARLQGYRLGKINSLLIRFLQLFTKSHYGAQTVGKFINNYVVKHGRLTFDTGFSPNQITNASLAVFSGLAGNTGSQTAFTYLAVGTSSTATSAGHTTLQAEIVDSGLARAAATVTRSTTTQTNDTLQLDKTWTASGSKTVEEIGVFNASSGGVMAGRKLTSSKILTTNDQLVATYKITFVTN